MKRAIVIIGLLGMLVLPAYGQADHVTANIAFDFVAAGTALPAGNYEFKPSDDGNNLMVRNLQTKKTVSVPIITRLAAGPSGTVRITFDEVGGKNILEAVWPGTADGYLVHMTKEKHTHKTVKVG